MIQKLYLFLFMFVISNSLYANQSNRVFVPHYGAITSIDWVNLGRGFYFPSESGRSPLAGFCGEGDIKITSVTPEISYEIATYKKNDGSFTIVFSGLYVNATHSLENSRVISDVVNLPNRPSICGTGYIQEIRVGSSIFSEISLEKEYDGPIINKSFSQANRNEFIQTVTNLKTVTNSYINGVRFGMRPYVNSFWNRSDYENEKNLSDTFDRYVEEYLKSSEKYTTPIDLYLLEVK